MQIDPPEQRTLVVDAGIVVGRARHGWGTIGIVKKPRHEPKRACREKVFSMVFIIMRGVVTFIFATVNVDKKESKSWKP